MASYQSLDIPYKNGMDYGMGINTINSQIAGKAVSPGQPKGPVGAGGQKVTMDLTIINTYEHLQKTLGISVEANARYGFLSVEGKFKFASNSSFNSEATFIMARCIIENPFKNSDAIILADAARLLSNGNQKQFTETFGDGYVRGMSTGGELYILLEIFSSNYTEQISVATGLQAEYNALLSGGSFSVDTSYKESITSMRTTLKLTHYQVGGEGDDIKFESSAQGVLNALNNFAKVVSKNPVPYYVQVANYKTLLLPAPINYHDLENKKGCLNEAAIAHSRLLNIRNNINFIIQNNSFYENVPTIKVLNEWSETFTTQLNEIAKQASLCVDDIKQCVFPTIIYPEDWDLYSLIKRKETIDDTIIVPNVIGEPVDAAEFEIKRMGLTPQRVSRTVETNDSLYFVISQLPKAGEIVKKDQVVTITYYAKASNLNLKERYKYEVRVIDAHIPQKVLRLR